MGLSERLGKLFGKRDTGIATLAADRVRAHEMHGGETRQSTGAQDGTRQRMEAELDTQRANRPGVAPLGPVGCPHTVLIPRWDAVGDMGHEDRASSYTGEACHQQFTAADGRALRQSEGERVRQQIER